MERIMNKLVLIILITHVILSLISLLGYIIWTTLHYDELAYLCFFDQDVEYANINPIYENCKEVSEYSNLGYFFTFYILYNNFVPISLYVTCETVHYIQAYYIDHDNKMFDDKTNISSTARTSNMNDDLGMIEYIFSDKTGTLTMNNMKFHSCSVNGNIYSINEQQDVVVDDDVVDDSTRKRLCYPLCQLASLSRIKDENPLSKDENTIAQFVFVLSVAHTVVLDPITNVSF